MENTIAFVVGFVGILLLIRSAYKIGYKHGHDKAWNAICGSMEDRVLKYMEKKHESVKSSRSDMA